MELGFLSALDWRVHVGHQEFETVMQDIEKDIALRSVPIPSTLKGGCHEIFLSDFSERCHLDSDKLKVECDSKITSVKHFMLALPNRLERYCPWGFSY